jgi:hypothetical protein
MRILDGRHLSRLRPATENEPTEDEPTQAQATDNQSTKEADRERIREADPEDIGDADPGDSNKEDWGTWTTLRPLGRERRLLIGSRHERNDSGQVDSTGEFRSQVDSAIEL